MKLFGFKRHKKAKKKTEWSKMLSSLVIIFGFIIAQEAMALMLLCIMYGFTATAAVM